MSNHNLSLKLDEKPYIFKSVIGDTPMQGGGRFYWEILPDKMSTNELKVGVTTKRNFPFDQSSFSDFYFGWSYYLTGKLRH